MPGRLFFLPPELALGWETHLVRGAAGWLWCVPLGLLGSPARACLVPLSAGALGSVYLYSHLELSILQPSRFQNFPLRFTATVLLHCHGTVRLQSCPARAGAHGLTRQESRKHSVWTRGRRSFESNFFSCCCLRGHLLVPSESCSG